ncbi:purine-binding chemotaxis protein CheW [Thermosyntropha lipolytica DSM 11003]|uniref:Purine-binding chemotaxis protein CheW n=1 Tax=Thermosyntropha lipolytica DSM 11003 TaxID=1123382 RepID=A0A1M5QJ97_9FIRM|nr:chemotaxis protein CheW [Thermosyntropha lipolytica]SHH14165.1 purine-binding chemotaxis protein CheW [Thermosyntropha lipolytica DSM 11003]
MDKQYVVFTVANQHLGLDIVNIQEITRYMAPTRMPEMPEYVEGIINLRGKIIPVINLRTFFNMEKEKVTAESRIIVVSIDDSQVGFLVDAVAQVTRINESEIEKAGEDSTYSSEYIVGLAKQGEKIILLLDPARLLQDKINPRKTAV